MNKVIIAFLIIVLFVISISFMLSDTMRAWINLAAVPGKLQVLGVAPYILNLYMDNKALTDSPWDVSVDGTVDYNTTLRLNATVYDPNGDCDGGFVWYVCTNDTGATCSAATYTYRVVNATPAVKYNSTLNCNYTATFSLEYYRNCGTSRVYGVATDIATLTGSLLKFWRYKTLLGGMFPYIGNPNTNPQAVGNEVDLKDVSVNTYNQNRGGNITKNGGNIRLRLYWNATNFTGGVPFSIIGIVPYGPEAPNTTFAVDNDTVRLTGAGYINPTPTNTINFPLADVQRCRNYLCTIDEDGVGGNQANMTTAWHIYVPSGVGSGTYNNLIEVNYTQVTQCG